MLGLESLSDDQLLGILSQVCREHACRRLGRAVRKHLPDGTPREAIDGLLLESRQSFREEIRAELGLERLAPGDLIQLRAEIAMEVTNRDDIVQTLAAGIVSEELEQLKAAEDALPRAIDKARGLYKQQIALETSEAIRQAVADGALSLINSTEEAKIVAEEALKTKIALIDEAVAALKGGTGQRFYFEIRPGTVMMSYGTRRVEVKHTLNPAAIEQLANQMRSVLG